jgi:hypothetical protein
MSIHIMKSIFQVIFMLFIVTFAVPVAFSEAEEFEFKLEVDHDFDDDEQIECTIEYDDNSKDFRFDEDDSGDDLVFEKSFTDKIDINCDESVDDITLQVYDQTGKEIYDEDFSNEDNLDFDLDDFGYDEDEDWFSIEVSHDFGSDEIDCDLEIDGDDYQFSFDSDDSSKVLTIEKNYDTEIKFSCDEEMDEIKFEVFDDDGDETYSELFTDDDRVSYDKDQEEMESTEVIIDIEHDFGNDDISCDLEIDGDDSGTYNFDEDSSSSDLKIAVDIKEDINFDCDDRFDEIVVRIYNEDGEKVDILEFKNEDEFDYEVSGGFYDWSLRITNVFEEDDVIDCDITVDGIKTNELELDKNAKISELIHTGNLDYNFELVCDAALDKVEFSTYFDGESSPIFENVYENELSFEYAQLDAEEQKVIDDAEAEVQAEEDRRVAAEQAASIEAEKLRVAEAQIAAQKAEQDRVAAAEKARLEALNANVSGDVNSGSIDPLTGKIVESVKESDIDSSADEAGDNNFFLIVFAIVGVLVLLVAFFSFVEVRKSPPKKTRDPVRKPSKDFKHNPKNTTEQRTSTTSNNRSKVDFDFLNKRN